MLKDEIVASLIQFNNRTLILMNDESFLSKKQKTPERILKNIKGFNNLLCEDEPLKEC